MIIIADCKKWRSSLVQELEELLNQKVIAIHNQDELSEEKLALLKPEYIFFTHWSYLIPEKIFSQFNCIIFHMTDVPFGRGGSPLQNLIARSVYETKVTALQCVKELDAGPVYLKKPLSLYGSAQEIYYRATQVIMRMIAEIVTRRIAPTPQEGEVTVFKRRAPEQSSIQDLGSLEKIYDYIRMLDADGYPKAFLETEQFRFEFSRASFKGDRIVADVEIRKKNE